MADAPEGWNVATGEVTSTSEALSRDVIDGLTHDIEQLRTDILDDENRASHLLNDVHAGNMQSARNLVHYLALRRRDVRDLQMRLARVGLSSLGRSEPHVLVSLDRVLGMLFWVPGECERVGRLMPGSRDTTLMLDPPRKRTLVLGGSNVVASDAGARASPK